MTNSPLLDYYQEKKWKRSKIIKNKQYGNNGIFLKGRKICKLFFLLLLVVQRNYRWLSRTSRAGSSLCFMFVVSAASYRCETRHSDICFFFLAKTLRVYWQTKVNPHQVYKRGTKMNIPKDINDVNSINSVLEPFYGQITMWLTRVNVNSQIVEGQLNLWPCRTIF